MNRKGEREQDGVKDQQKGEDLRTACDAPRGEKACADCINEPRAGEQHAQDGRRLDGGEQSERSDGHELHHADAGQPCGPRGVAKCACVDGVAHGERRSAIAEICQDVIMDGAASTS